MTLTTAPSSPPRIWPLLYKKLLLENVLSCSCTFLLYTLCCKVVKMKFLVLGLALIGVAAGQFINGRILEPPVPQLCAQRVIHERGPDGKSFTLFTYTNFYTKNYNIIFNFNNLRVFNFFFFKNWTFFGYKLLSIFQSLVFLIKNHIFDLMYKYFLFS